MCAGMSYDLPSGHIEMQHAPIGDFPRSDVHVAVDEDVVDTYSLSIHQPSRSASSSLFII